MRELKSMSEWHPFPSGGHDPLTLHQPRRVADIENELPRIITKKELRRIVPYSPQHILRLEKRGKFPKRLQLGARRVGWYFHEVRAWLDQRSRGSAAFTAMCGKRP